MEDFRSYSPEDAINANLQEISLRFDRICEQELAHLRELAAEITASVTAIPDFIPSLPDRMPARPLPAADSLPQSEDTLHRLRQIRFARQKILLCREIRDQLASKGVLTPEFFFPDPDEISIKAFNRVVYQKSSYADDAYLQFAHLLAVPRASYAHSFLSACEDVYNGLCEYCILPVENTAEGPLNSFLRLIRRYELKIAATCSINGADRAGVTRFALLRRNMTPLLTPFTEAKIFEFDLPNDAPYTASHLLLAAQLCDLDLLQLNTVPRTDEDEQSSTRFSFSAKERDLQAYLLYLAMEVPHYQPLGIYSHMLQK